MTKQKHLKARIRERMEKTGESYATARRYIIANAPEEHDHQRPYLHFPGSLPAPASLRILLANADIKAEGGGGLLSEAMVMGVAGGIGAGVFTFRYEEENFSSFYVDGRHLWWDDREYLENAVERLGLAFEVRETGGKKKAASNLEEMLEEGQPVIAWVDQASLPYRGMPSRWEGGSYHVLVVHRIEGDTVVVGDLAHKPIELDRSAFAEARARIKKQKNRLFALQSQRETLDLEAAVLAGIDACVKALQSPERKNFGLEAVQDWAVDLTSQSKDGWRKKFPDGRNLWRGLVSIYDYIEHYGTGGGLCRPIFSDFLREASEDLGYQELAESAEAYAELGQQWSHLAQSALPQGTPLFERARALMDEKAERFLVEGANAEQEYVDLWQELEDLEERAAEDFPLDEGEIDELLAELSNQVSEIYEAEKESLDSLAEAAGQL